MPRTLPYRLLSQPQPMTPLKAPNPLGSHPLAPPTQQTSPRRARSPLPQIRVTPPPPSSLPRMPLVSFPIANRPTPSIASSSVTPTTTAQLVNQPTFPAPNLRRHPFSRRPPSSSSPTSSTQTTAAAITQDLYPETLDHLFLQLFPFLPEIKPIDALSSTVLHHRYFCYNLVDGSIGRDESIEPVAAPTFVRACDIRIDLRRIAGPPRPTGFRDLHLYKSWMRPLRVLREAPVP
ncbi:hypothetical protein PG990_002804 [Apiospora arundinis]